jgi:hypothetical protein
MFYALAKNEEYWKSRINLFLAFAPVIIPNKEAKLLKISS